MAYTDRISECWVLIYCESPHYACKTPASTTPHPGLYVHGQIGQVTWLFCVCKQIFDKHGLQPEHSQLWASAQAQGHGKGTVVSWQGLRSGSSCQADRFPSNQSTKKIIKVGSGDCLQSLKKVLVIPKQSEKLSCSSGCYASRVPLLRTKSVLIFLARVLQRPVSY